MANENVKKGGANQPGFSLIVAEAEEQFMQIAASSGNAVTWQKEASFALQAIEKSEYLQKAKPSSIRNAVVNVASVGLSLNPAQKLAYLVPRDGLCCLDISYIGLTKIATDSGSVLVVKAECVRKNDEFEYMGPFERPTHKFNPFASTETRGEVIGAYTIAKLANGETLIETLSLEEINKIRATSKAKNSPAWNEWFDEMAKKSVIKRAYKMWPTTDRLSKAVEVINEHEGLADRSGSAGAGVTIEVMPQDEMEAFKQRIAAAETKEDAKAIYLEAVVVCAKNNDLQSRQEIKDAMLDRAKNMDAQAAQQAAQQPEEAAA